MIRNDRPLLAREEREEVVGVVRWHDPPPLRVQRLDLYHESDLVARVAHGDAAARALYGERRRRQRREFLEATDAGTGHSVLSLPLRIGTPVERSVDFPAVLQEPQHDEMWF